MRKTGHIYVWAVSFTHTHTHLLVAFFVVDSHSCFLVSMPSYVSSSLVPGAVKKNNMVNKYLAFIPCCTAIPHPELKQSSNNSWTNILKNNIFYKAVTNIQCKNWLRFICCHFWQVMKVPVLPFIHDLS